MRITVPSVIKAFFGLSGSVGSLGKKNFQQTHNFIFFFKKYNHPLKHVQLFNAGRTKVTQEKDMSRLAESNYNKGMTLTPIILT